jgi:ABC-2 type transport system permease protein
MTAEDGMHKIRLVAGHELITVLSRRSFLLVAFGLPVLTALIFFGVSLLQRSAPDALSEIFTGLAVQEPEGYVDHAGVIRVVPDSVPSGALIEYPDEAAAQRALEAGDIPAYFVIAEDFVETGKGTYIRPDVDLFGDSRPTLLMEYVLRVNLLGGDEDLAVRIDQPLRVTSVSLSTDPQRDEDNPLTGIVPYAITFIFYIVLLGGATLLLNSVASEKENRVIEVLVMSIAPRQLLVGKIIGLGLAGLAQTIIWMGVGFVLLNLSGNTFNLPQVELPPSILIWGLIFFLLGYAIFASLMAGAGALVPNLRESGQATIIVLLPLIIPLMFNAALIEEPNNGLAIGLSLFPLTAPIAMMTRLAAAEIPIWQPLLAAALMLLTSVLIIRAVSGLFRAQTLLSGQSFKLRRFFAALAGRV